MNEKGKFMTVAEMMIARRLDQVRGQEITGKAENTENNGPSFAEILKGEQQRCPYSSRAIDGVIEYNGVVFVCDYKTNAICLGDMSNPRDVLRINLPSGGCLKVNVNNFGDLSNAIGMFSPEDIAAIMKAIAQYNHCTKKIKEAEDLEIEAVEKNADHAVELSNENAIEAHHIN